MPFALDHAQLAPARSGSQILRRIGGLQRALAYRFSRWCRYAWVGTTLPANVVLLAGAGAPFHESIKSRAAGLAAATSFGLLRVGTGASLALAGSWRFAVEHNT